jgi:hypothetical protein
MQNFTCVTTIKPGTIKWKPNIDFALPQFHCYDLHSIKQEVLERINLPTFLTLFKNVICIKTSVCPNITLMGNSVLILKHSHIQNNVSKKKLVGSS